MNDVLLHTSDIVKTSWDQLKAEQAAFMLQLRAKYNAAISRDDMEAAGTFKAVIVAYLSKSNIIKKLTPEQINDIADDIKFINQPWYDFHVTYLKTKYGKLLCPEVKMSSITFWQLVLADAEYSRFLIYNEKKDAGQVHSLNRLIAILYQPEPGIFDDELIDDIARALPKGLKYDLKYLILHTYSNIRTYIVNERCKNLFQSPPDSGSQATKPVYTGKMWQDLLFDLSDTPAFLGLDKAKNARIYDALDYLEKKALENKPAN